MAAAHPTPGAPVDLDALVALAKREYSAGRFADAAAACRRILAVRPDIAEVHGNLGLVLWKQGQLDEAAAAIQRALALKPDYAEAHDNLGIVLTAQGKFDDAAANHERALALKPDHAAAHNNLGNVLWRQGKLDEATTCYQRALAFRPNYAEAINNLGVTLREQFKMAESRRVFERLQALEPDSPAAQAGLAICYLIEGDYDRGWPAYEGRLRLPGAAPRPRLPRWTGEPLSGRSLLLVAEQGLGDTLLFLRYARLLKERGARVVLAAQAALGRLLASHPDVDELLILGSDQVLPFCDFYLPLLSAPLAFGTTVPTIPREVPYLWADPELTEKWRQELAAIDGFKIGIAWQGSRAFDSDRWRSIPLADFAPLARLSGVRLISLQKGFGSEQLATIDFPVIDLADRLDGATGPFMDTAAVIRNLDLVVTADTAIAHLAGALGAPVWVALPFSPYWLWLQGRDDSPWYPNVRLFRQTTCGRWADVFERIGTAAEEHRAAGR